MPFSIGREDHADPRVSSYVLDRRPLFNVATILDALVPIP